MPLDQVTERRIRDMASERGQDPDAAVAEAERVRGKTDEPRDAKPAAEGDAPTTGEPMDMLIGHLSFVRVSELRGRLGLPADFPDQDLPCGVWQRKHETGGAAAAPAPEEVAP